GLKNVKFGPFVSKDEYPMLVKDADVGLVSLSSKNKTPVVPGKILGYMAASVPVIAFLNKESDGHKIIKDAQCGYSEVSNNVEKAVEAIIKIYNERHRLKEYGENGFNYVKDNFEKDVCIRHLEKLF
uniref:glycosyltransferase n=1 Tax=Dissulfurispira sp. TaxID=2817609 RepID=UPI002FDA1C93